LGAIFFAKWVASTIRKHQKEKGKKFISSPKERRQIKIPRKAI
jgi:hypothetical protein